MYMNLFVFYCLFTMSVFFNFQSVTCEKEKRNEIERYGWINMTILNDKKMKFINEDFIDQEIYYGTKNNLWKIIEKKDIFSDNPGKQEIYICIKIPREYKIKSLNYQFKNTYFKNWYV